MNTTTVETPKELRANQNVFPDWMDAASEGAEWVAVTRKHTFAGTFVIGVVALTKSQAGKMLRDQLNARGADLDDEFSDGDVADYALATGAR